VLVAHAYNPSNKGGRDRRITVGGQPRQIIHETLSQKKKNHKKGLVEWLKVWALSSSPRTAKKKKEKKSNGFLDTVWDQFTRGLQGGQETLGRRWSFPCGGHRCYGLSENRE
jgi:hypothetical protein